MRWLIVVLALVGCQPAITVERLDRAENLVWSTYGRPKTEMPAVVVHLREDCHDEYGNSGLLHSTGACLTGWYGARVDVLVLSDFASSSLAHEMYHAALAMMSPTHDADQGHRSAGWGTIVIVAGTKLKEAGL